RLSKRCRGFERRCIYQSRKRRGRCLVFAFSGSHASRGKVLLAALRLLALKREEDAKRRERTFPRKAWERGTRKNEERGKWKKSKTPSLTLPALIDAVTPRALEPNRRANRRSARGRR